MAKSKESYIDISSSDAVEKVYRKDHRFKEAPKRKSKGLAGRIAVLVLSLVMLLAGSGCILIYYGTGIINYDPLADGNETPTVSGGSGSSQQNTPVGVESGGTTLLSSKNVLNILLFGKDYTESDEDYGRSDTTILLSIDNVHKKLKLTSFQRDTFVAIPGYGDNKINAAFSLGGERLAINTIETNFGIKVDKYATVDFDSFREIIEVLGGIDIELTIEEIEYINAQIDVNDQLDVTSFLQYDPTKEKQMMHLDGYQALWYARDRGEENLGGNPEYSFSGDDWDRTQRQRNLLDTILHDLRTKASLKDLVVIANKVGPLITTNLKKGDITFLVTNILTYLNYDLVDLSLPTTGNWRYSHSEDGQSIIEITNWQTVRKDVADFIYEEAVTSGNKQ